MANLKIWSSIQGIIAMVFFTASAIGGIFVGSDFWLLMYKETLSTEPNAAFIPLIFMIIAFVAAFWYLLTIIFSFFKTPKALFIVFAFLSMLFVAIPTILLTLVFSELLQGYSSVDYGAFLYVSGEWFAVMPLDFVGFWLGILGGLAAFITGFFIPVKEDSL